MPSLGVNTGEKQWKTNAEPLFFGLQKFITFSSFNIFEPFFRRKFRLDVLFISYDRVKSQFQAEGFQKCESLEMLSDAVHCLRKLQKFITSSIFIGLRPFLKHRFRNFVGYIFASGSKSGLCSEDFGLWVFLSTAHENKLNFQRNQKTGLSVPNLENS